MFKLHSKKKREKMMRNERIALVMFIILGVVTVAVHMIWGILRYDVL